MALAFQDIKLRYRGSVLGPFWLTISTVVMVASMGVIYSDALQCICDELIFRTSLSD